MIKVVGWGLGVDEGDIVLVGDGLLVGVFEVVAVMIVGAVEDSALGVLVGEGCIVDVFVNVIMGGGLEAIGNPNPIRLGANPPRRIAIDNKNVNMAKIHPAARVGPKLKMRKENIATVIAKMR
jgi:hypothetical protein